MMAEEMRAFWPENCRREGRRVVVSERFKDERGEPVAWEIKPMSAAELQAVYRESGGKGGVGLRLIAEAVQWPDLASAELQDMYGVMGAVPLLLRMLTPGEFAVLEQAFIDLNLSGGEQAAEEV